MGLRSWWNSRKLQGVTVAIAAMTALATPKAVQAESARTRNAWTDVSRYYDGHLKGRSSTTWSKDEKRAMGDQLITFLRFLARDIIQDLRKGNLEAARADFERFRKGEEAATALGRYGDIHNYYVEVVAAAETAIAARRSPRSTGLHNLPNGTYTVRSPNIEITITVRDQVVDMQRRLNPLGLTREEWEAEMRKLPPAVRAAIEDDIKRYSPPLAAWLGLK